MSSAKHQYGKLISEIKNSLIIHLNESITDMFIKVDDSLFKSSNSSNFSSDEQNRHFELRRKSDALKNNIVDQFINIISLSLRPHAVTKAEKEKQKLREADELSLVEQSELEEIVLVKSMSDNVDGYFSEALSHLEARLEHLALQTPDIFYKKALRPFNIFQAFDDALDDDFDPLDKQTLLKFFNDHVALKLGKAYDATNNLLIEAGILPQIKLHANKSTGGGSGHNAPSIAEQPVSEEQHNSDHGINHGGYAMTAAPGHTPSHGTDSSKNGVAGESGSMPANQLGEIIGEFLGGAPLMPSGSMGDGAGQGASTSNQFFPVSTGGHYGHQEVLNALSNVQQNPAFNSTVEANFDSEAIKQAILSEISKASGGAVTKRINHLAEKTIDFIELVFDAIIDDENISDTMRALLLRLQIPVIKASMIDQEFFINDDHPARVLLDQIAHVGIGVADRHDETYSHLDKIVTTLVNEFDMKVDSFQIALDALNTFIDKRETEAQKKEAEEQKKILSAHARSTVLKSLRLATKGKVLPDTTHSLILKRWPTMMYNHYLKHGKENDAWINIVDTLRSIIISVQPLKNTGGLEHLVSNRDHIIKSTRAHLQRNNQSEKDITQIIQDLIDIHDSLIDHADFGEEIVAAEAIKTDTDNEFDTTKTSAFEEMPTEEDETPKLQLPSNLTPGMWFQVYNGDDRAQRRCKLSIVILEDQKLVFVNYQGEVILEKNMSDFLDEMNEGKSKVIMGHSVFDHALNSVVNGLQAKN